MYEEEEVKTHTTVKNRKDKIRRPQKKLKTALQSEDIENLQDNLAGDNARTGLEKPLGRRMSDDEDGNERRMKGRRGWECVKLEAHGSTASRCADEDSTEEF
jgi:hypothetical protein